MNFQSMEYFIAVAEERSFSRAAERLFVTQQTLSAHIASLEKETSCKLITRKIPLELTYAGEVFLRYARHYQETLLTMNKELCDISQNQKGILRIGINYSWSRVFMPQLISDFQKNFPNIQIKTYEDLDLSRQLFNESLDIIITNLKEKNPNFVFEDFYRENTLLVLSKNLLNSLQLSSEQIKAAVSSCHLKPLKYCPFIMNEYGGTTSRISMELFSKSDFVPITKCEIINIHTIMALCLRDVGACFVPQSMLYSFLSSEEIDKLVWFPFPESMSYNINFAYNKRRYQWSVISSFIQTARAAFPPMSCKVDVHM
ncbi:MAG: LysR family transcriptional regulator [Clostridiales bacterium]|nr:LysR family transcriptional regulator [Clostridiales bacterium]